MSVLVIVGAALVGPISFYGGMRYQQSKSVLRTFDRTGQFNDTRIQGRQNGNGQMMRPVSGEIISKDDSSVTIKQQDGSTKIVLLSDKTVIVTSTQGNLDDLKNGENLTVFGTNNADGSVSAQNISLGNTMFRFGQRVDSSPTPTKN